MNPSPTAFTPEERLISLKAAALSGTTAVATALALLGLHSVLRIPSIAGSLLTDNVIQVISLAVALVSGALFGIVYRYTIRHDGNPQLAAGATAAFGLVRGLAQVEAAIAQPLWQLALALGESMLLFAAVAGVLRYAMQQGWIQPFGRLDQEDEPKHPQEASDR